MKKLVLIVVIAIIVIVLIVLSGGSKSDRATTAQVIRIGGVLSLSGAAAQDGESIKNGMELAKVDLKKQGVDVEFIYQDDKTEAKDTVSAINAVAVQKVDAIIGPTWSFLGDAGVPVINQLKLVALMPANTSEYVSSRSPYAFFTTSKVEQLISPLATWLKEHNKKRIVLVYNKAAWGEVVGKAVEVAAKQAGAEVVYIEAVQYGSEVETLPTTLAKIRSLNADLLFFEIDDDKGLATLFKKVQELNIPGDIMSVTTSLARVLSSGVAAPKNDFYIVSPTLSVEFKNIYTAHYGKAPGAYADRAYDSVMLLADAMKKKGEVPLVEYLRTQTDYPGLAGRYKFDVNNDIIGGDWVVEKLK